MKQVFNEIRSSTSKGQVTSSVVAYHDEDGHRVWLVKLERFDRLPYRIKQLATQLPYGHEVLFQADSADGIRRVISLADQWHQKIAEAVVARESEIAAEEKQEPSKGASFSEPVRLPDGSGVMLGSFPLPKDHWLFADHPNEPPMPMRVGIGAKRNELADQIQAAARYAVRVSTMNGKETDFDPDAVVQNMIVGLLGYFTEDGLSRT